MDNQIYEPYYRKSKALVIGIDSYSNSSFSTLSEAENDASSVASLLKNYGFDVKLILGRRASKRTILEQLHNLRSADFNDRLLIYFACHGYTLTDNFNNEQGYIAVYDTVPEKDFTAIKLDEVTEIRFHTNAKHVGFIFDTCFSGQALGLTRTARVSTEKFLTRRAYQVISAGAGDQPVADFQSMTQFMINIIQNNSNDHELTTLTSIGYSLHRKISADTRKTQIPQFGHLKGSQGGDFIISIENQQKIITTPKLQYSPEASIIATQNFPKRGIYTAEVDLIGRIDDITNPTVMTVSAGLSVSLWISGSDKEEAIQKIKERKPKWGATRIHVFVYSTLLYLLLKDHFHKLDSVTIDSEYQGYESVIKQRILNLYRKNGKSISKNKIKFGRLEKTSPARMMASTVYKSDSVPDLRISADEILSA